MIGFVSCDGSKMTSQLEFLIYIELMSNTRSTRSSMLIYCSFVCNTKHGFHLRGVFQKFSQKLV